MSTGAKSDVLKATESETDKRISEESETEISKSQEKEAKNIGSFDTVDIYGEKVTEAIFADADLTVVNVWGTFCGPCISEMSELGEWAQEMPENVQIIGIVMDVNSREDTAQLENAQNIVEKTNSGFTHLIAESGDFSVIMSELIGVPTTYFVDSEGNFVGNAIIGADIDGYKEAVQTYLNP